MDLWSKHWAFLNIDPRPNMGMEPIKGLLRFERMLNTGALFGLGKGWTPLFIAASFLALGFVLFLFIQSSPRRRSLHVALACVLAGAVGNLYDRAFAIADVVHYTVDGKDVMVVGKVVSEDEHSILVNYWPDGPFYLHLNKNQNPRITEQGVVRDFLKLRMGPLNIWPWIFNVADILLVVGVCLLLLNFHWDRQAEKEEQAGRVCAQTDTPDGVG
ncbi:MAG: signal peptidase II [Phycisphaerales bacterium]|nr:signal peptidase II [Phycisphaerales bacterium]